MHPGQDDSKIGRNTPVIDQPIGVLVMAYGGPNSLDEIPGYLADIRSGRVTTPAVLEEIAHNYRQIGGRSPLLDITRRQVKSLSRHLDSAQFKLYLGMRHWSPWIEETTRDMLTDGITQAISLVMAPHYSSLSIKKYQEKIESGLKMYRGQIEFEHITSYHDAPGLIEAFAQRVQDGLDQWPEEQREDVHIVFSAHSLPERVNKMGDPYEQQLLETARLIAEKSGLSENRWSWSYQSAGRSPEPWLGPQLPEHLIELAGRGVQNVVCIPVGFVCDHVEILYDIDIQAQRVAHELGIRLIRPAALNDDPVFIAALAALIRQRAHETKWVSQL